MKKRKTTKIMIILNRMTVLAAIVVLSAALLSMAPVDSKASTPADTEPAASASVNTEPAAFAAAHTESAASASVDTEPASALVNTESIASASMDTEIAASESGTVESGTSIADETEPSLAVLSEDTEDLPGSYMEVAVPLASNTRTDVSTTEELSGVWFVITAENAGSYTFKSYGSEDTYIFLYDADGTLIDSNDDSGTKDNFSLKKKVKKGETYYLYVALHFDACGNFQIEAVFSETQTQNSSANTLVLSTYGVTKYDGYYRFYNSPLKVTGVDSSSAVSVTTSDTALIAGWYTEDNTLYICFFASKTGTYTATIEIDGKKMTEEVQVTKIHFTYNTKQCIVNNGKKRWASSYCALTMYKGETTTLKIVGAPSGAKVTYTSSKKSVAKVNSKGKITATGRGKAVITATVAGISLDYPVEVSYKTAIKALRYCYKNYKSTYSQAKRMKTGYYDCSSYVWRAYHAAGLNLVSSSYAPTAADMAKWCVKKKYMAYSGNVPVSKLQPGDLIFWCGESNGRYKGIYHVDIYQGQDTSLTVYATKYYNHKGTLSNVMVARPCGGKRSMKTYK